MIKNPFEMFRTEEDDYNWDKYDEQLDHIELSELDRDRARRALRYFRTLLGEDFLREARQTAHPMLSILKKPAPRERLFMAELEEMMIALENADKFGDLLRRIRNPHEAAEALSVLPLAYRFLRAGFAVSFEPDVEVTQPSGIKRAKKPDMKIADSGTGQEIFVEVSRLLAGSEQVRIRSRRTYDELSFALRDLMRTPRVHPYAKFHRGMDDEELRAVIIRINGLAAMVKSSCKFGELNIEGVIEVGIAPWSDSESAEKWAAARDMRGSDLVEPPPMRRDESFRACRKVLDRRNGKGKVWQIPDDGPGIIVFPTDNSLILITHDLRYVVSRIEQAIATEPKVFCVVLTLVFRISEQRDRMVAALGDHLVLSKTRQDGATECAVIIRNSRCKVTLKPDTIEKIRHAFVDY